MIADDITVITAERDIAIVSADASVLVLTAERDISIVSAAGLDVSVVTAEKDISITV